ncbi:MAG: hypothetical protein Q8L64_03395 [bacterium]|nr:hypothetical protein [bacterium]
MSEAFLLLHGAVNMFGGGRSMVRIALFAVFFLIAFAIAWRKPGAGARPFGRAPFVFLSIALIVGAAMQISFAYRIGISPFEYALVISGPEVTSTSLMHNHFGKAAVGDLANMFVPGGFEKIDPGSAIASVAPISGKIAFGAALLALLAAAFISFKRNLPTERRFSYALGFSALLLVAVKTALDGGILAEHGVIALGLLLAIASTNARSFWRVASISLVVQFLFYAIMQMSGLYTQSGETWLLYSLMSLGAWCFVTFFISRSAFPEPETSRLRTICAWTFTAVLIVSAFSQLHLISYRNLSAYGAKVATYIQHDDPLYVLERQIGDIFIYEYKGERKVGDIIAENKMLDNTYPVSVPWMTCLPTAPATEISFVVRGFDGVAEAQSIYMPACTPRPVSILHETIKGRGETVIITNIQGL